LHPPSSHCRFTTHRRSDLAYGDRGRPPKIGGGDCLVFTIEILKIKGGKTPKA